jgi:putative addiction module component (TIGR02574 family)
MRSVFLCATAGTGLRLGAYEQRAEFDHRIARHEQNASDAVPWEQAKAGLFKKP